MEENLRKLADKVGIVTHFSDAGICRKNYEADENTVRFLIEKLGFKAGNAAEIEKSLEDFDKKRWQKTLNSIYIVPQNNVEFDAVVSEANEGVDFALVLQNRDTKVKEDVSFEVITTEENNTIGKTKYVKLLIKITSALDVGYYDLVFKVGTKNYKTVLAVAPDKCYENPALSEGRIWGYALQLYSVRSERNWGVGDFTDLKNFVRICSSCGADVIGLNPLNVLPHYFPEDASPYASISRLFLNPIYIDVESVPEFKPEDKAGLEEEPENLRNSELIRYTEVYNLKIKVMEKLFARFKTEKNKERTAAFEAFCKEQGEELFKLAVFECLNEEKCRNPYVCGWNTWEEEYRNSNSLAVRQYAKDHADRIEFLMFLQFEAARQLAEASRMVVDCGLKMGFYNDLAVGVSKDSSEYWTDPDVFIHGAGAGAPPDAFFPCGQKWGLGAFNPYALKERGYEPFIRILRANMKSAGALRIDHVMGLMRLYIIPDNSKLGTYVLYNFEDMLNIVAIESHLNKCTVVGESIGNVPEGFLDKLKEKNIYSLSVLWAERKDAGWGDFNSPSEYPVKAFTSVGTHDMAPLRMWWFGYDIEQQRRLGMIENDEAKHQAYHKREVDRWKLLFALDSNGVWPEDNQRMDNYIYGQGYPQGIEEAVHRFVSRSASKVFLAQPEDILHVEKLQNLPGTDRDKHPNWRRKLPVTLEKLEGDIAYIRNINAIRRER
ncbi:MAG: 4-alpha-glucanotransferase [Alphaproteobacteria bacterium]